VTGPVTGRVIGGAIGIGAFVVVALALVFFLLPESAERTGGASSGEPIHTGGAPRIVALGPSVGIILQDLGLEEFVVGRHGWDLALDPELPVCGDLNGIDYENLIGVRPTHVLLEWGSQEAPRRLESLSAERGWTLRTFDLLSLDDIESCVDEVGGLFADELAEGTLEGLRGEMARAWSPREGVFEGSVLLLAQTNPPAGVGPGSFHHQVLERIGGRPAIVEGGRWVRFDTEDIVRMAPEGIVLIAPRERGASQEDVTAEGLVERLGPLDREAIPAVREGRLALIDHPHAHTSSTAMIGLADEVAAILERWTSQRDGDR